MEQEDEVERPRDLGDRHILLVRFREHHVQEIVAEGDVLRVHEGQPVPVAIDAGDNRPDL
ncbi:hypothetical protein D3C83_277250 [compost metagenome]